MSDAPIRVAIVDDQRLLRDGLRLLLDSTGAKRTSQEFLDKGRLVLTFFRGHW